MKNKLLCAVLCIALFSPTVVAIVSYNMGDTRSVSGKMASTVVISDLDGKVFTFDKNNGDADNEMLSKLQNMLENSEKISALPDPLVGKPFYKMDFKVDKLETAYQFYFATDGTDSYYVMSDGSAYSVEAEHVESFLLSECAQSIYSSSHAPVLTLSGEHEVSPVTSGESTSSWMYKNFKGTFVASALEPNKDSSEFDVEGGLSLSFDREPDKLAVKVVSSSGEELFNDLYENIGSLKLPRGSRVNVTAIANWYEDAERDYFGTMNYDFAATVSAPAEFYPGVTFASQGGIISITAMNVKNPDKITFSSSPDIGFDPTWHKDGEYVRTLIAFDDDLAVGNYELTFTYAGTTQNVVIDLRSSGFGVRTYTVPEAVLDKAYSNAALDQYKETLTPLLSQTADTPLWDGHFLSFPAQGAAYSLGYGHMINITGKNVSLRHEAVDYKCPDGTAVGAANSGKVVYVGELDYPGKLVVIDHGWGVKSWYMHLSSTDVKVGDEVKRGDTIGKAGSTGFTNQSGFSVAMSLYDKPIIPYTTWDDNTDYSNAGIKLGIPMYEKQ